MKYKVSVYKGDDPMTVPRYFADKEKARDYMVECLVKYFDWNVELTEIKEDDRS